MKVKELIEQLSTYNKNLDVDIYLEDEGCSCAVGRIGLYFGLNRVYIATGDDE